MSSTDASAYLNSLLAATTPLWVESVEYYQKEVCYKPHGKWEEPWCETKTFSRPSKTAGLASVINSRVVEMRSVEFGATVATSIPEQIVVTRKTIKNFADVSVISSVSLSISGTESWQVTKSRGVSTTAGASVTLSGISTPIGSGSVSVSFSQTVSTSVATTEGNARSVTRSTNDSVSIGPKKSIQYELLAYQTTAEIPFRAVVIIDGDLSPNLSGVSVASQLLSELARTLTIEGSIQVSALSEGFLSVIELPQTVVAVDASHTTETTTESFSSLGTMSNLMKMSFFAPRDVERDDSKVIASPPASTPGQTQIQDNGGTTIGPPEGTHYEILYTEKVYRPTPQCGFNDIGLMNGGVFRIEARRYTTYVNGVSVATWEEKVEVFEACWAL
jgi:hypothetical protein